MNMFGHLRNVVLVFSAEYFFCVFVYARFRENIMFARGGCACGCMCAVFYSRFFFLGR